MGCRNETNGGVIVMKCRL